MQLISAAMAQESTTPAPAAPGAAPAQPATPHPAPPVAPAASPAQTASPTAGTTTSVGAAKPVDPTAPAPPTVPEMMEQLIPILVVLAIVYIMVIRPRARKEKAELEALRNVRRGDVIATTSGFVGKVTRAIDDNEVEFELAPNVRARLLKSAIAEVRSRGEPVRDAPAAEPVKVADVKPEAKAEAKPEQKPARPGRKGKN